MPGSTPLDVLIERALVAFDRAVSVTEYEAAAAAVLDYSAAQPDRLLALEDRVARAVLDYSIPCELLAYWIHELRGPLLTARVVEALQRASNPRETDVLRWIESALHDDWSDKPLYRRYSDE